MVKVIGNEYRSCDNGKRIDLEVFIEVDLVWFGNWMEVEDEEIGGGEDDCRVYN